ncbi:MAG: hypothetical protein ACK5IB_06445 [Qingshengfaniella sp.]
MEDFSFWQEVAKQAIASSFAAVILLFGAWVTFVRTLGENRRKAFEERWQTYAAETLVTAYRDLEALHGRDNPLMLDHENLNAYRLKAERAIRDIQFLGDKTSAEIAQRIGENPGLLQDGEVLKSLFLNMRAVVRSRVGLGQIDVVPTFLRYYDDDRLMATEAGVLARLVPPEVLGHAQALRARRDFLAGQPRD